MKIIYHHHSGFSVELEKTVLLFDYYTEHGKHINFDPSNYKEKNIVVFASHNHSDHYDKIIDEWINDFKNINYVYSFDIDTENKTNAIKINANSKENFCGLNITTFKSNDKGVAFLVEVEGKNIYHSGDLNWWHWKGEPDKFNVNIERTFKTEIDKIKGIDLDVAFIPTDLRLEEYATKSCEYILENIKVKNIFPMHFWNDFNACNVVIDKFPNEKVFNITRENQEFDIND